MTSEVKFAERKSGLLQSNKVWKKILPFIQSYKVTPPLHHPKNNFMSKRHLIQPLQQKYTKSQRLSPRFSSGANIFGQVSHSTQSLSTELVRKCLAFQHFDINSADWISDNVLVISSWYLQTMRKEIIFLFSRRSWGRNAWRTPKNICVGGWTAQRSRHVNEGFWLISDFSWVEGAGGFCTQARWNDDGYLFLSPK